MELLKRCKKGSSGNVDAVENVLICAFRPEGWILIFECLIFNLLIRASFVNSRFFCFFLLRCRISFSQTEQINVVFV
ncbi:hypothetical protein L596_028709 [Steinernema carpocapsae]|uniref:Uncharacterized protein n=1 Tax=Steinernema carpocapsae TaxID=34508 RepID=A0A4U5LZ57_STECR|nr:hypothetical protein L596_028709 [Steinernema carpocapsae]